MEILLVRPGRALSGHLDNKGEGGYPGDKSISHRAALFAALADGESLITNFQVSGVTTPMLTALSAMGIGWSLEGTTLSVHGKGFHGWLDPLTTIFCGNSATTMRLLTGAMAAVGIKAELDGSPGLRRRPMGRIVEPLKQMGVRISSTDGCAPLFLEPSAYPLKKGTFPLEVASAQVKSCLLLAGLRSEGEVTLVEPAPSRDHTERMLREMGVNIQTRSEKQGRFPGIQTSMHPPQPLMLKPLHMEIPGDFSAAAFLLAAACIVEGSDLEIHGVGMNPTRTGLLDALNRMGASIEIHEASSQSGEPVGDLHIRYKPLKGISIAGEDVVRMIDEFPAFAIVAAFADGETVVRDAAELRYKESDRITDLCRELRKLGVEISELPDGFRVIGKRIIQGGVADPRGDHRLAMAFALSGLAAKNGVKVLQPEIIHESFPNFRQVLQHLGADIFLMDES
jgi:3-phosphoshikimate 1-carboxyvinyltransferase